MAEAKRDQNHVTVALGVSSVDGSTPLMFTIDPVTGRLRTDASGSGGIVESVVGTANRITVDSTDPANPIVNIALTYVGQNTITTLGTVTTGTWNGTVVAGQYGGTGVANTGKTVTIGGNFEMSGAFTFTGTITGNTTVTFPTSGTLATTTEIANMVTAAAVFSTDESILRSDGAVRGAQATGSNATLSDAGAATFASNVTANSFIPTGSTAGGNRMYLPAANTIGFSINGTGELQLTASALSPMTDDGLALGTTALGWTSLFGDTGFVINIENGDWVATHTAGILTVGTGDLRVTTAGTNTASVVTVGGTQTLTAKTLTSPTINAATLGGTSIFAEGGVIAYDAASSADGAYTGFVRAGTAGATLAFGDLVYLAAADSRWELADADAASTSDRFLGMCVLAAANDGDPTTILLMGFIRADAAFPALTIGSPAYVGETAGDIQTAIPTGADNVIRRVGYAWTADELYFNPSMDSQITVA